MSKATYVSDFNRLTKPMFEDPDPSAYLGGQSNLTPLRNKAREAMSALADAQTAADQGRADDCLEGFRRAKAAIDQALGGQGTGTNVVGGTSQDKF